MRRQYSHGTGGQADGLWKILFLANGTADSLITAELSNWNGKAIKIPRIEVNDCKRDDIKGAGMIKLRNKHLESEKVKDWKTTEVVPHRGILTFESLPHS